jgi:hypothetical protein
MSNLTSNPANIRFNGTGRAYAGAVAGTSFDDLGELDGINFNVEVSTETLKSTRNASRGTIIERETERNASLSFGLREMSNNNLKMVLLGSDIVAANQAAAGVFQEAKAFAADLYVDLGKVNVFVTKITGTITGALAVADLVTGALSGATGKIAYKGADHVVLVNVSGTFQSGEQIEETEDTNYITATGIETQEDVCITSAAGDARRVQGTDYTIDPDYGYVRQLSSGDMTGTDVVSYDHEAVDIDYFHGMSAGSVEKKILFVTDKDDQGPRFRYTFHKVQINLNGEFPLLGDGASVLQVSGSVLKDTTQPSGQEFFKKEIMS